MPCRFVFSKFKTYQDCDTSSQFGMHENKALLALFNVNDGCKCSCLPKEGNRRELVSDIALAGVYYYFTNIQFD